MGQVVQKSGIAVIGVACYYPGASNPRELWENILARRIQFRRMLDQRLPLSRYYDEDPKSPEKTYGSKAAFIEDFTFDWMRLRLPRQVVESTDIAHWLALDTALRTFEDAGFKLSEIPVENTGVVVGNTLTGEQTRSQTLRLRWPYVQKVLSATLAHAGKDVGEIERIARDMEKIYKSAFFPITEDSLAGGLANTIAGRICNFLNLKGGGYIVDGACSSSLLSVVTAANALKLGDMDMVLAGGVDVSLDPFELVGFSKAGALAKDQMRVYDQRASGFVPGEGCGFVLLKRLEDAVRDKNYIYAVINGWGISSDGKGGIMEPSVSGQAMAIERAYKSLDYKVCDVDFVEGHGTGTTKGDRVELEGIATAIGKAVGGVNNKSRLCGVTSFKSIVGHTKAAAGVGGLIKAIFSVNQRILPPTASCIEPNQVFLDKAQSLYPLIQGRILSPEKIMRAGISSAGFGGINCHMTIESKDPPLQALKPDINERALLVSNQSTEVFVFASRTTVHLKKVIQKFKGDLRNISVAEMADLAALLNKKVNSKLPVKAAVVTDTPEHLYAALALIEAEIEKADLVQGQVLNIKTLEPAASVTLSHAVKKSRIGLLYPGQGTQRLNMSRPLVERFSWARDILDLSKLSLYGRIYKTIDQCFTVEEQKEFQGKLTDTRIAQPAVVINSVIWTEFLSRLGVEPVCVGGHSLGELTAFYKAGVFDQETLIKFAELRGESMADSGSVAGGMLSLLCSLEKAETLISKVPGNIIIANINSPLQVVASGGKKEIEELFELAEKEGISARRLNVSSAFHTSFMLKASEKIRTAPLLSFDHKAPAISLYSCMDGAVVGAGIDLKDYFAKQVVSPVHFIDLVKSISSQCDILIEVGHGRVLTDLVAAINKEDGPVCFPVESSAGNDGDLNRLLAQLFVRSVVVRWEELYANRLIKTFVPASRKKFIVNQCERPLKIDTLTLKEPLVEIKSDDVLADSPKNNEGDIKIDDKDGVGQLLVNLTQKMTGFDAKSITLDLRLLDDLNLDSIKAAELIGQVARALGIAGQIDPSQISNNTLGQIRDRLLELLAHVPGKGLEGAGDNVFKRYHSTAWVRNFIPELRGGEHISVDRDLFKSMKSVILLSEEGESHLVDALAGEFKGSKVEKIHFQESSEKNKASVPVDCLVAVLPRGHKLETLNRVSLKAIQQRLHRIVQLACSVRLPSGSCVALVQFGGGYFGEGGGLKDVSSACGKALISTLALERSDLKVRVIDFDAGISEDKIAFKVVDELSTHERFNAVGYDAKLVRRVVHYSNSEPVLYPKRDMRWSNKDVVLVTGGGKGITAACALEFARATKATMVLLGRSPVPKDDKDASDEIVKTLKKYRKEKLRGHYIQCDVTDENDLGAALKGIRARFGKVTGVIHGAGLNSLKRLKQMTVPEAFQESLPKVMGAVNICNALADEPPKLIAAITSIIGVTGMEGSGWYGLSNEILNLHLHQFKASYPQTQVAAIAYSVWDEIGMGAKLGSVQRLSEKGIGAIPAQEGVRRFRQFIENDPGAQQVIVAARLAGLDTWKPQLSDSFRFRFIEKILYSMPGVELVAQARLSVQDDPYLLDHNWRGSLLFPFVFGFEAMAQAVAQLLNVESFDQITAKDINLDRPITVPQDTGTTIEIHAEVLEKENKDAPQRIRVEVYSEETAFQKSHFSAVFEIGPLVKSLKKAKLAPKKALQDLDLDVKTDIYGSILFQGKLFQCIDRIHELYYDAKTKKGECLFTAGYNKTTDEFLKANKKFKGRFLTGDPFFLDSMLQSMQVIIPQDISLPTGISKIVLGLKIGGIPECSATCRIKKLDADHYRGDVVFVRDEASVLIEDCRLKVLDTVLSNPSANDLVNPAKRDQKIIEEKLVELSCELGFVLPVVKCLYDERLKKAPKALRHKIEMPLMREAVKELLKRDNKVVKNFKVEWLKSGKPLVRGKNLNNIGISLSHTGSFLLVIVGYGQQGCDVEEIRERDVAHWEHLLCKNDLVLFNNYRNNIPDSNAFATALWCSREAVIKVGRSSSQKLHLNKIFNNYITLSYDKNNSVLIFWSKFSVGAEKALAFVLDFGSKVLDCKKSNSVLLKKMGYNEEAFSFGLDYSGPQGQLVFIKSYPVTFRTNKLPSRSMYFSSYFDWMGEVREQSANPIMTQLAGKLSDGNWGIATYFTKLEVLGNLRANDVLETHFWSEKTDSTVKGAYDLCIDWHKKTVNGCRERVAFSRQRMIWVKIIGHGIAQVDKLPSFLEQFMENMASKRKEKTPLKEMFEEYRLLDKGRNLFSLKVVGRNKSMLYEKRVNTSFENSNLVGNIYFSNYAKWLGMVADLYFYNLDSSAIFGDSIEGEFICVKCEIDHISEAMPFDEIQIEMFLDTLYKNAVDLCFDFYLIKGDQKVKKLAHARHEMLWTRKISGERVVSAPIPISIMKALNKENK